LHLCKVYTLQMQDEAALQAYQGGNMGHAMGAIELAARVKERYDASWIVPNARRLDTVTFEEMLEMAACGAKVLMLRCVEYARRYHVPIHVRSSYSDKPGTIVTGSIEDTTMEDAILTGVAHDRSEAKVTVVGVPDVPGYAAKVFRAVADADVNIDMVLQNISKVEDGKTDITFTCSRSESRVSSVWRAGGMISLVSMTGDSVLSSTVWNGASTMIASSVP
jgi:aspartate kinase